MGIAAAIAPMPSTTAASANDVTLEELTAQVDSIIVQRCTSCHAKAPSQAGFSAPPKGIILETSEDIARQAQTIHQQVVITRAMPIGNLTQITEEERALIDQWFQRAGQSK